MGCLLVKTQEIETKKQRKLTSLCDVRHVPRAVRAVYAQDRGYVVVRHLHDDADDGDDHVHHVHACGCGGLLHDERILELAHPHVLDQ